MKFSDAVGELKQLLRQPNVPPEVIKCALNLVYRPFEAGYVDWDDDFAIGTARGTFSFQASDRLLNFLAAARAGKWEDIIVAETKHNTPPTQAYATANSAHALASSASNSSCASERTA